MRRRSADLLSLGVALPLMVATPPVDAAESDDVMKVVEDVCLNNRDNLKAVSQRVSKLPFAPDPVAEDRGPPVGRATWLAKLGSGSTLAFFAKNASALVSECRLVSHIADLANLVERLKEKFDLGEPVTSEFMVQLTLKGQKIIGGRVHSVELVYGFEENKPSGGFTLTINR